MVELTSPGANMMSVPIVPPPRTSDDGYIEPLHIYEYDVKESNVYEMVEERDAEAERIEPRKDIEKKRPKFGQLNLIFSIVVVIVMIAALGVLGYFEFKNQSLNSGTNGRLSNLEILINQTQQRQDSFEEGVWSTWQTWTTCSSSCGHGFKTRKRDCMLPMPHCMGQPMDIAVCNTTKCPDGYQEIQSKYGVLREHYSSFKPVYTDGPKGGAAIASVAVYGDRTSKCCLPDKSSIFSAEMKSFRPCTVISESTKYQVAFQSHGLMDSSPGGGDVLVFIADGLNIGNAYNPATGVFTVPVKGIYWFSVSICSVAGKEINFGIYFDSKWKAGSHSHDNESPDCSVASILGMLEAGVAVYVKTGGIIDFGEVIYLPRGNENVFMGLLIN